MHFLGMCHYVGASTTDLQAALAKFDKSLQLHGHSISRWDKLRNHQALTNEIRFHNQILEY